LSTKTLADESKGSKVFQRFIEKFPDIVLARQVREFGESFVKTAGGFADALYKGNIKSARDLADLDTKKKFDELSLEIMEEYS
jgi:hypothetical protein